MAFFRNKLITKQPNASAGAATNNLLGTTTGEAKEHK